MSHSDPVTHIMNDYDNEIEYISNLLADGFFKLALFAKCFSLLGLFW